MAGCCDFGDGDTDAPERAASHGLDSRFHDSVFLVTNIALKAMTILSLIRDCVDAGLVPTEGPPFAGPVLVRNEYTVMISALATAALDTTTDILEAAPERLKRESVNTDA